MAKDKIQSGILGDINPETGNRRARAVGRIVPVRTKIQSRWPAARSTIAREHSGSRDVTEGVTGGLGTETGGTRNYRQGTGQRAATSGTARSNSDCGLRIADWDCGIQI